MDQVVNPENYKPQQKGKADFFSWQLYKWMKKKPDFCHIYKGFWNSATGYDPERPVLYIGLLEDGCFMGHMLRRICTSGNKLESWAFCSKEYHLDEWVDITEEFFADYQKRGVCAIHDDTAHKWTDDQNTSMRTCEYCGKTERQRLIFVPQMVWEKC